MNEEHEKCCEMANIMLKITRTLEEILNTINAKDKVIFILI